MRKIALVLFLSAMIAASLSEAPLLINRYMYPIPVHHTPLRVKKAPLPDPVVVEEAPIKPHEVYGVPGVEPAPEIIIEAEPVAPGEPALEYGVPEVILAKLEPAPAKPAPVYGVPDLIAVEVN